MFYFSLADCDLLFFKIFLEHAIIQEIKDNRTRYEFGKLFSIIYVVVLMLTAIRIWIEDTQVLLVS